jgi:riboflavin kinase/FMN adenylyltransferase
VNVIRDLATWPTTLRRGAVTIGNFDGVHRGHQQLIDALKAQAARLGGPAIVFTFDPHPGALLDPRGAPPSLTTLEKRVQLLSAAGVDAVAVYPTDRELLQLGANEFFERIVLGKLGAAGMVEGDNFRFGRGREGTIERLKALCSEHDLALSIVQPLMFNGATVSSSAIRAALGEARVEQAAELLGRPYAVSGQVVRGAGRGRQLGVPTANLGGIETLLPGEGVYAGFARRGQNLWPAAIHLGPNVTFEDARLSLEAHLIGCDEDLYDQTLEVAFTRRLRDIVKFDSIESLITQMQRDIAESAAQPLPPSF